MSEVTAFRAMGQIMIKLALKPLHPPPPSPPSPVCHLQPDLRVIGVTVSCLTPTAAVGSASSNQRQRKRSLVIDNSQWKQMLLLSANE